MQKLMPKMGCVLLGVVPLFEVPDAHSTQSQEMGSSMTQGFDKTPVKVELEEDALACAPKKEGPVCPLHSSSFLS